MNWETVVVIDSYMTHDMTLDRYTTRTGAGVVFSAWVEPDFKWSIYSNLLIFRCKDSNDSFKLMRFIQINEIHLNQSDSSNLRDSSN